MHIISLSADNFMRLRAVSITPSGNVVELTGENAQGKTSILDAIWAAMVGRDTIPAKPIRTGEEHAKITLRLGDGGKTDLKVTRTFNLQDDGTATTSVKVEDGEGATKSSPQKLLDTLIGQLSFDPLAFARMTAKGQYEALKPLVTGADLDKLEEDAAKAFNDRTAVNRRAKEIKAQINNLVLPQEPEGEPADLAALEEQFANAGDANAKLASRRQAREQMKIDLQRARGEHGLLIQEKNRLLAQIEDITKSAAQFEASANDLEAELADAPPLPEPVDLTDLRHKIAKARDAAEERRKAADARKRLDDLNADAQAQEAEAKRLTAAIEAAAESKAKAVASAKLPHPGLDFGPDGITLNGEPFAQASDAERLRASVAIAAAMNPTLRVIRVREGSLLDKKSWKLLADMAKERKLQVWVETIESNRPTAFVIEDGSVVRRPS